VTKPKFVRDRKTGERAEQYVQGIFHCAGIATVQNDGSKEELVGWDFAFRLEGKEFRVEVKNDIYEAKSGNIAVEYYNPKLCKPSGIMATHAHFWVYVLADRSAWMCSALSLLDHVNNVAPFREIACGGDSNAAMKLYRRDELFETLFVRIDDGADIVEAIKEIT